jgi:transcription-repair coupling factor (superfamily II helicase)
MTADAIKRLEAIEAAGELGVGFTLATHDLEIRGAGEMLGEEQSGQISAIGYSLYMKLLARAVDAIRAGRAPNLDEPLEINQELNFHAAALIPQSYLPDVHTRLMLYKRIASALDQAGLEDLQVEMIDRFGMLPDSLKRLFQVTGIKYLAQKLGIARIDLGLAGGRFEFTKQANIDPAQLVRLVQSYPSTYHMAGPTLLRVKKEMPEFIDRLNFATEFLSTLTGSPNQ